MRRSTDGRDWDSLYFKLVEALARFDVPPAGACHIAAEYADAAINERRTRNQKRFAGAYQHGNEEEL